MQNIFQTQFSSLFSECVLNNKVMEYIYRIIWLLLNCIVLKLITFFNNYLTSYQIVLSV